MKKNILTVIILAMSIINIVLSAVLIFAIVPTAQKTNQLITKVAQVIDLELESPDNKNKEIAVSDIETYSFTNKMTIMLAKSNESTQKSDESAHYAIIPSLTLSMNKKNEDTAKLKDYIAQYEDPIEEIVTDEFSKYTIDEVNQNKNKIKEQILAKIQDLFKSDFIINVSFGNLLLS